MDPTFIVPAPRGAVSWEELPDVPLELARARVVKGRLFEKHILNEGTLIHPKTGERINVDGAFTDSLLSNFERGVCDIVQVPVANDKNEHVEGPAANIGEVVGLRKEGGKLYALIDARDDAAAAKLGKTYLGASAFLSTDYTDTGTGKKAGPTLLHVAVTNRPYVTGLEDFKEMVAASGGSAALPVMLSYDDSGGGPVAMYDTGGEHGHQRPDGSEYGHSHDGGDVYHVHDLAGFTYTQDDLLALAGPYEDTMTGFSEPYDDSPITTIELSGAEAEFGLAAGALEDLGDGQVMDNAEISCAGEAERLIQAHREMTDHRYARRSAADQLSQPRVYGDDIGLTASDMDEAVELAAGWNGNVIPEGASAWDGGSGDRAMALSRLTWELARRHGYRPEEAAFLQGETERLAALASPAPRAATHDHYHCHPQNFGADAGHGPVLDMRGGHSHPHKVHAESDHAHDHEQYPDDGAEADRLIRVARAAGFEIGTGPLKVTNHGPRPGSGNVAHRGHLRRAAVSDGNASDPRQPRRANTAYPGVRGGIYDTGGIGAPEEISRPILAGLTATEDGGESEYYDSGSPDQIWARHAGRI